MSRNTRACISSHHSVEEMEHFGCADRDDVADLMDEIFLRLDRIEERLNARKTGGGAQGQ